MTTMKTLALRAAPVLALSAALLVSTPTAAQTAQTNWESGKWQYTGTLYAFLPSVGGSMSFPVASGGASINVDADALIDGLNFTFMGSLGAHNGRWGMFTDVLYLDVGGNKSNTREFSVGRLEIPASTSANLDLNLKGFIWTLAGEYRIVSVPAWTVDVLAGARLFAVKPKLDWSINGDLGPIEFPVGSGSKEIDENVWDGIVGIKGRYAFGESRKWFVPFYLDVGTGQSDVTWQGATGLGYAFNWGSLIATWRYLDYQFKSGKAIESLNFNGPMLGVTFHW
jgi:hypothetical protein